MKVVLFFSRFTLICNTAFLLFAFFAWMESRNPVKSIAADRAIGLPFLKELIVILGFTAIIINFLTNFIYLVCLFSGRLKLLPGWLVMTNFLFLVLEFYYFFLL